MLQEAALGKVASFGKTPVGGGRFDNHLMVIGHSPACVTKACVAARSGRHGARALIGKDNTLARSDFGFEQASHDPKRIFTP